MHRTLRTVGSDTNIAGSIGIRKEAWDDERI